MLVPIVAVALEIAVVPPVLVVFTVARLSPADVVE
jgi:hypothetical protein